MGYARTLTRVEDYFDRTATQAWAALTSDAPVSRVRATVRAGRDEMRAAILAELPRDLTGARVLDAGCGTGALAQALAGRGAEVLGVDIAPKLIEIARARVPGVRFEAGDMTDPALGRFDFAVAMDSLIYYDTPVLAEVLRNLAGRVDRTVFTVPPRTPALMAMWRVGKLFPRADRSPVMVPQSTARMAAALPGLSLRHAATVHRGFYVSAAHVLEGSA
ncbi:MAG: magnesium protoporphyrin IX methyltransferase [Paracoccaceae bacterium]